VSTTSSNAYARRAFDLIDAFETCAAPATVLDKLAIALKSFGYSSFLVTGVPEPPQRLEPFILLNGWSQDWTSHYVRENYYLDDPVAAHCRSTVGPFEWSDAPLPSKRAAEVIRVAQDFGLKRGFLVPVARTQSVHACVTMAGERPDFEPSAKKAIHLLSLFAHARIMSLLSGNKETRHIVLSPREREAMTWAAAGKSSGEMAVIMGITERTVNFLVARAQRKLNAANRTQAVVNAIRAGEINI